MDACFFTLNARDTLIFYQLAGLDVFLWEQLKLSELALLGAMIHC